MDAAQLFLDAFGLVRMPVREASILLDNTAFGLLFSAALILVVSWLFRENRKLAFLFSALAIAFLLGFFFKPFLQEGRPCLSAPSKIPCPPDYSLPSMHALLAFTLAVVSIGSRSFAIYLLYALFVAFSRVYLGVHLISEVAAGLALAFFACVLTELAWKAAKLEIPRVVHLKHDSGKM